MLVLYALPVSGYCAKVRIVLRKKGVAYEERVPHGGSYTSEEYRHAMPPGSIPAIDDDGFRLFDSEAIAEYLNERYPTPPLLAKDHQTRARQRALSHFHNGRLEPTVRALFPLVRNKSESSATLETAAQAVADQLAMLVRVAEMTPWSGGNETCIADCALPVTILMGQDILDRLGRPLIFEPVLSRYLDTAQKDDIIADELVANRAAVAAWLDQFVPLT